MPKLNFPQPNWQPNWHKACNESLFGEVGQDGLFILQSNVMTERMSLSLTGTKIGFLFREIGHIFKCCGSLALLVVPNDLYVWR